MKRFILTIWLFLALAGVSDVALAACVAQTINFGETKNGTLATDDCVDRNADGNDYYYDYYEFNATGGQQIAISNASTAIDADLFLLYPDNSTSVYDDDGGGGTNARIPASGFLTLTQTGKYAIFASSALPLQTGAYSLTLTQAAPPTDYCATLRLDRDGDQIAAGGLGSPASFGVFSDPQCTWHAQSNNTWISVTAESTGNGNGLVGYLVAPNTDSTPRTGTLTVASRTFTVNQLGTSGPATTTPAAAVAAGGNQSLLLRDDGNLWAWGGNQFGELGDGTTVDRTTPVLVMSRVQAAAAGRLHTLALKTDGTLWAMGLNGNGQLGDGATVDRATPVQVMSGVRAVAAGWFHSLALKTDGTLWAMGLNGNGQLGDGTTSERATPVLVMSGVQAVAAGGYNSLALKTDGTLWAWGWNVYGQLGDGTTADRAIPVPVMSGVQAAAGGLIHSLARKTDGTLWAWGSNFRGQLGDGTTVDRVAPVLVMSGVQAAAAGGYHSLARKTDGTLWAWGWNGEGELGDGTAVDRTTPVLVMNGVRAVAAGVYHTLALKTDGTPWAWGWNGTSQLGDGTTSERATPVLVISGVQAVATGGHHSLALKTDGTLWAWGYNSEGQLGDGTTNVGRAAPAPVQGLSGVQAVAAGRYHSLALRTDGTLWTWGKNSYGQLGDGTNIVRRALPAQVLSGMQAVAAGERHSLALKTDGTLWTWGGDNYGQLGDGTTVDRATPVLVMRGVQGVAAGVYHSLALKTDGTLWAWGWNGNRQLGDGTTADRATPVLVQGLSGVQAIAAGFGHSLALKTDGTVWAWGGNSRGQLGDGTTVDRATPVLVMSGVQAVAAGWYHSLALKTDGTVWGWGLDAVPASNSSGGQSLPQRHPFLRGIIRVAAGTDTSLALTAGGHVLAWGGNGFQQLGVVHLMQSLVPIAVRDLLAPYAGADLVVEYFNPTIRNGAGTAGIGHYFITAATAEAASIDTGGSGPGWARTGRIFRAWNDPAKAPAGAVGVCRFYARVPNSHFYTANAVECQSLKNQNPSNNPSLGWSYEGIAFYTVAPAGGSCGAGYHPVYRSYNNRFNANPALNDGNHRITPSYNDYRRSIRFFGYTDEGIAFCSPTSTNPGGDLQATYTYPGTSVQSGTPVTAEFLFGNNGAGQGDGGSIYIALPPEVLNWSVSCAARYGASCPGTSDLTRLREGQGITTWPAGGTLNFSATGTAPQVASGGDATLNFASAVANASGTPDSTPANDMPSLAQTVVKAATVCNSVLNPSTLQLGSAAQTPHVSLIIGSGCQWGAQSSASWLTVAPAGGTGDAMLTLSLAANATIANRSGSVTIEGKTILVTQSGIPCTFTAAPATLTFTPAGQNGPVLITAPAGCDWSARSSASWLAVSPASGSGSASLTITAQGNTATAARSGAVTLGNLTIPVTQSGVTEVAAPISTPVDPCASLRLQREGDQVAPFTGAQSFDVIADGQCIWRAQSGTPWITLIASGGGSGNGTVRYKVDEYYDGQPRKGSVTVGTKTFTVNQLGNVATDSGGDSGGDGGGGGGGDGGGGGGGGSSGGGAG